MRLRKWSLFTIVLILILALANPAMAAGLDQPAPLVQTASAVPDQYIVVLKDGATLEALDVTVNNLKKDFGVTAKFQYKTALKGFAAKLNARALEAVRRNPNVAYVEPDQIMTIDTTQTPATWGIDRIDQRSLPLNNSYGYTSTGSGVTAYVIDTGIRVTHTQFGGRASIGYDTVGDGRNGVDCNGHGTHVSGTIGGSTYGVAKGVKLVAVRVLNCSGSGTTSGVVAGIDWVTAHAVKPAVANMSLGGGASTTLDTAVKNSINSGVVYAIAAGNDKRDACRYSPARVPEAITVGATTSTDARASYSNYGTCLDIFAPGSSITSAWYSSDTATNTISGTSMATPHVAGVAALYLQFNPTASPTAVRNALVANGSTGKVGNAGKGSPNILLFTNY